MGLLLFACGGAPLFNFFKIYVLDVVVWALVRLRAWFGVVSSCSCTAALLCFVDILRSTLPSIVYFL